LSGGRVFQINVSPQGGVPKLPVPGTRLRGGGVEGDCQRELKFHGGPERAVCLFSLEQLRRLQQEGHPILPGSTGENLTLEGLEWAAVVPGVRLRIGEARVEVSSYTSPCKKIRESFLEGDFTRVSQKLHPGWSRVYARILQEGQVKVGDRVEVLP